MVIKDFIGKVVYCVANGKEYELYEITSPCIAVRATKPDSLGCRECLSYMTINGDPISNGTLVFKDPTLKAPFLAAYKSYCHSRSAYWEEYGYWMRKD